MATLRSVFTRKDIFLGLVAALFVLNDFGTRLDVNEAKVASAEEQQTPQAKIPDSTTGILPQVQQKTIIEYFSAYDVSKNRQEESQKANSKDNALDDKMPWRSGATRINGSDFRLTGIFIQDDKRVAIILHYDSDSANAQQQRSQVSEGDILSGLLVKSIKPNALLLVLPETVAVNDQNKTKEEYIIPLFPREAVTD